MQHLGTDGWEERGGVWGREITGQTLVSESLIASAHGVWCREKELRGGSGVGVGAGAGQQVERGGE